MCLPMHSSWPEVSFFSLFLKANILFFCSTCTLLFVSLNLSHPPLSNHRLENSCCYNSCLIRLPQQAEHRKNSPLRSPKDLEWRWAGLPSCTDISLRFREPWHVQHTPGFAVSTFNMFLCHSDQPTVNSPSRLLSAALYPQQAVKLSPQSLT